MRPILGSENSRFLYKSRCGFAILENVLKEVRDMEKRLVAAVASMALTALCGAGTITVDNDGAADFDDIQSAVDYARDGDLIIVAAGIYTSDQAGHVIDLQGKRITLRSQAGAETTIIDGENMRRGFACFNGETPATVIEGFTIRNGYAIAFDYDGNGQANYWETNGGGMFSDGSSPTIRSCVFEDNFAGYNGGGLCNTNSSDVMLIDCLFDGNTAGYTGGGVACISSSPTVTNCSFSDNLSPTGGGMNNSMQSAPVLEDCVFSDNNATIDGGGMHNSSNSTPELTSCSFSRNTCTYQGGGMKNWNSNPMLSDCTFDDNEAGIGGGMFNGFGSEANIVNNMMCGKRSRPDSW